MDIDIRVPLGALFTAIGVVLCIFGLLSGPAIYQRSLGIDVNFVWGSVLLAFGVAMLFFGRRLPRA